MVSLAPALLPVAALTLGVTAMSPPTPDPVSPSSAPATAAPVPPSTRTPTPPAISSPAAGGAARSVDVLRQRWQWPLAPEPTVARRFERPASTWGPGHRGVDLSATSGQPVLAVAAGRVVHVGVIAGRGTVSVLHAGGVRTTYEPLTPRVHRGQVVRAGQVIGLVDGSAASHCAGCLHLGALRGRVYLDPLALLRPGHVVLLPLGTG
ncbi:Peptidase family M23 [Pedococcus cremeus]|uniref:Peptidase family M23 n=1 Tax=Pedococcus cremeus TaxID=587636 RepID=A0A1H9R2P1_9MICO|nr:Peptidase family M23 [Pedococcus cremeus]